MFGLPQDAASPCQPDCTPTPPKRCSTRSQGADLQSPRPLRVRSGLDPKLRRGKSPMIVEQYPYGTMAIRGARAWSASNPGAIRFSDQRGQASPGRQRGKPACAGLTSTGQSAAGRSAFWCSIIPANFRFPQPVRLHPALPYFCFYAGVARLIHDRTGKLYVFAVRLCGTRRPASASDGRTTVARLRRTAAGEPGGRPLTGDVVPDDNVRRPHSEAPGFPPRPDGRRLTDRGNRRSGRQVSENAGKRVADGVHRGSTEVSWPQTT